VKNAEIFTIVLHGKESEEAQDKEKDKKEINFLKKCNRQILIFKIIALILVLFIFSAWVYKGIKSIYQYKNSKLVHSIISDVYENTQNFKNNNNFVLSINFKSENSKLMYSYKDGKFKQETISPNNMLGCNLTYGKMIDQNIIMIEIWDHLKIVDSILTPGIGIEDKEHLFKREEAFIYLENLNKKSINSLRKNYSK
jgi:hypothetical protein